MSLNHKLRPPSSPCPLFCCFQDGQAAAAATRPPPPRTTAATAASPAGGSVALLDPLQVPEPPAPKTKWWGKTETKRNVTRDKLEKPRPHLPAIHHSALPPLRSAACAAARHRPYPVRPINYPSSPRPHTPKMLFIHKLRSSSPRLPFCHLHDDGNAVVTSSGRDNADKDGRHREALFPQAWLRFRWPEIGTSGDFDRREVWLSRSIASANLQLGSVVAHAWPGTAMHKVAGRVLLRARAWLGPNGLT
ncbi:hypothetical protein NL676_035202 [Syzygium grande]|nr:hypothetical protein NL676_035202 [Syzygium grande]